MVLTPAGWLEDATIAIESGRISAVRGADEKSAGHEVSDWGPVAVVPGTVNAHGHAFQNILRGFADDRPFAGWRDDVLYPFSERLSRDDLYTAALFAFAEALHAGVTTTVDFFYLHDEGNDNALTVMQAARDAGIRLVLARTFYDAAAPTKAPARYREDAASSALRCRELAAAAQDDPLVSVQPAPHSLHAASPETLAVARDVARDLDVPWHLHLAEAEYERAQVEATYGATPVRLLAREGLLDDRLITVHTVWVDDEEMNLLAAADTAVVHCPGANAFLGDGIARVPEMLERGIRVALGADGGCANNRQSIFDEMRLASLFGKARLRDGGAFEASAAFALGTVAGAEMLGIEAGSIEPGRTADLVAVDLDDLSLQPLATLDRNLVHSMQTTAISKVMVGGEVVMEGRSLLRVDEADLRRRIGEVTAGWTRP